MDSLINISIGLIVIIIGTILLIALFQFIGSIVNYFCMPNEDPIIPFKLFTNLYSLSPIKWALYNTSVAYYTKNKQIDLSFNFIDTFKYKRWRKRKER